ncbi:MAG: argininosuccinate synthase [Planctomycetota bacterium]|nr:argininosuccinate synthase [Planctomycetota bacterium]
MKEPVILAYTGGATTSLCIHYLANHLNRKVLVYMANLGGTEDDTSALIADAYKLGASQVHITDLRSYLVEQVAFKALRADAEFANGFFLARAIGNICMIKGLVNLARENGVSTAAHGSSIVSSEQNRFENLLSSCAPEMEFISPPWHWEWHSREQVVSEVEQLLGRENKRIEKLRRYSLDENDWGTTMSYGPVEDQWVAPPENMYRITQDPTHAPAEADEVEISFLKGLPVKLNGNEVGPLEMMKELTFIAAEHGIGRADLISDGINGIKYREICEYPAARTLFEAHKALELITQPQRLLQHQELMSIRYGETIMNGNWFTTIRRALDSYFNVTQERVSGTIRMRLSAGDCLAVGRKSPHTLVSSSDKDYTKLLNPKHLEGFNKISTVQNRLEAEREENVPLD